LCVWEGWGVYLLDSTLSLLQTQRWYIVNFISFASFFFGAGRLSSTHYPIFTSTY
jgi:hypothetical protein